MLYSTSSGPRKCGWGTNGLDQGPLPDVVVYHFISSLDQTLVISRSLVQARLLVHYPRRYEGLIETSSLIPGEIPCLSKTEGVTGSLSRQWV